MNPGRFLPVLVAVLSSVAAPAAASETYLTAPGIPAYGMTRPGFTLECWIRVRSMPGFDPIIIRCVSEGSGPCESIGSGYWVLGICKLSECDPGTLAFTLQDEGRCELIRSRSRVDDGDHHHVAVTFDGSTLNLFVDGKLEATQRLEPMQVRVVNGALTVGNNETLGSPFDGEIDELRIWNVARSETEIRRGMTREIDPCPPELVGYWRFNGDGNDRSRSGNALRGRNYVLYRRGKLDRAADIINIRSLR